MAQEALANYTHDGYLCHIAILAPQSRNGSSHVRYEGPANYEELHDTTSLCQMCQMCQICRGQIMKNCDGSRAITLANHLRQAKWFISEVIVNNDKSHHKHNASLQGSGWWTSQVTYILWLFCRKKMPHRKVHTDAIVYQKCSFLNIIQTGEVKSN